MARKKINKDLSEIKRERMNLSLSVSNLDELKILLINRKRCEIKVNEKMSLSGPSLFKYLIHLGLQSLDNKYGEIRTILKNEGVLNGK